jgi:Lysylphosphatidylglycerol synthase TM region
VLWAALAAATALQLIAGVVRVRGWFHVIRLSCPQDPPLRYRDVVRAQLGGCGWNAVLPARAGDAVKVALVRRRMPETPIAALAGTLAPPALIDAALTAALAAALFASGVLAPHDITPNLPAGSALPIALGLASLFALALALLHRRLLRIARDARAGLALLGRPRLLATQVLPWQLASRALRLLALACVLLAAGLPFALAPALLLMALQGAASSVSPTATAVRVALLAGLFAGAGGVSAGEIAAVLMTFYATSTITNLAASAAVIALELRTLSPQRIVAYARASLRTLRRAPASA